MASKLKVVERVEETKDSVSLFFKKPFWGGFSYKSGQFLTLKINIDGEDYQRAYSLNSTPGIDKLLSVTVKKVEGGKVSNYIFDQLKVGDKVEILKPKGNFILSDKKCPSGHIVLFGGGSGITPLFSMAKYILHTQKNAKVSLVFANQNEKTIIFKSKLEELCKKFEGRFNVQHYLAKPINGWNGFRGLITNDRLGEVLGNLNIDDLNSCQFYMCGPTGYMNEVEQGLLKKGVATSLIFKESFVPLVAPSVALEESDAEIHKVKVLINKKEHSLDVPSNKTILDAALSAKISIPYSCRNGICASCLCKVEQGSVKMKGAHSLSDKDQSKGYVLACMSYVESDGAVLKVE